MKTRLILRSSILFCLITCFGCSKNGLDKPDKSLYPEEYTFIPDGQFEQLLIDLGHDDELDNFVLNSKIKNIKNLKTSFCRPYFLGSVACSYVIKSLKGIENFENLESLTCTRTGLTSLDVSNNSKLKFLDCSGNGISSLDLGKKSELMLLDCSANNISSLDLSNQVKLKRLIIRGNNITHIDIRPLINLIFFDGTLNNLSSLDISKNSDLINIRCIECPLLECVQVNPNQLERINALPVAIQNSDFVYSLNCD